MPMYRFFQRVIDSCLTHEQLNTAQYWIEGLEAAKIMRHELLADIAVRREDLIYNRVK